MSHIRKYLLVLNHFHHSHPVATPYLADILFGVAAAKELNGEVDNLRGVSHARYATVTVEVGADAYMVNTHDTDGMLKVRHGIHDVCLSRCIEESRVESGVGYTATFGKCPQLVVGKVAWMVTQTTTVGV